MDAERLTPPSPTRDEVIAARKLARIRFDAYAEDRAEAILETLHWILGEGPRPCLAPHSHIDQENH